MDQNKAAFFTGVEAIKQDPNITDDPHLEAVASTLTPDKLEKDLQAQGLDPAVITQIVQFFVTYGPTMLNWILSLFKVSKK